jgi:hypothetical protein
MLNHPNGIVYDDDGNRFDFGSDTDNSIAARAAKSDYIAWQQKQANEDSNDNYTFDERGNVERKKPRINADPPRVDLPHYVGLIDDLSSLQMTLPKVEEYSIEESTLDGACRALKFTLPNNPKKRAKVLALAKQLLANKSAKYKRSN